MNKKILFGIGAIATSVAPMVIVVSCNESSQTESDKTDSTWSTTSASNKSSVYVPKMPKDKYPHMDDKLYDQLKNGQDSITMSFFKLKGKDYFKNNPSSNWDYDQNWVRDRFGNASIAINYFELYDYAYSLYPKYFKYLK